MPVLFFSTNPSLIVGDFVCCVGYIQWVMLPPPINRSKVCKIFIFLCRMWTLWLYGIISNTDTHIE